MPAMPAAAQEGAPTLLARNHGSLWRADECPAGATGHAAGCDNPALAGTFAAKDSVQLRRQLEPNDAAGAAAPRSAQPKRKRQASLPPALQPPLQLSPDVTVGEAAPRRSDIAAPQAVPQIVQRQNGARPKARRSTAQPGTQQQGTQQQGTQQPGTQQQGTQQPGTQQQNTQEQSTQNEEVSTSDLFVALEGSDMLAKDSHAYFQDVAGGLSRHIQSYALVRGATGIAYTPAENLSIAFFALPKYEHNLSFNGATDPDEILPSALGIGFGASVKYRFLPRKTSVFGLAASVAPYWLTEVFSGAVRNDTYGVEFRLMADKAIQDDILLVGVNFAYRPETVYDNESAAWYPSSYFEASTALSLRIVEKVFFGGEVHYHTRYEGAAFDRFAGWALFAGPTLSIAISDSAQLGLGWFVQLVGRSADDPENNLDLVNYERQRYRLKATFVF
jgi:hypothetical protein